MRTFAADPDAGASIMDVPHRRRLFETVGTNPGAHLRDLARRTNVPLGTALYHLDRLERAGLIIVRRDGRYKRYFAGHALTLVEKQMLSAFRHAVPRRIAAALVETGWSTQRELCARIGVSRSTLSFQVNQLVDAGIVQRERTGAENRYRLSDLSAAARVLRTYAGSLGSVEPFGATPAIDLPIPLGELFSADARGAPASGG